MADANGESTPSDEPEATFADPGLAEMPEPGPTGEPVPMANPPSSVADSEIPDIRADAKDRLVANNTADQRAIVAFAVGVAAISAVFGTLPGAVLAACIVVVLPFRWMAGRHFRTGDLRRGIVWANLGSWYLLFPLVVIIPDTLPIAIQNVIGPAILAATYLDQRMVARMVPGAMAIAVAVSWISLTTDGFGVDDAGPRWAYLTVILAYVAANMWLVMGDVKGLNSVHLATLRRAVRQNRALRAAERELRDSRRRLLVAADTERVRLERDLHDGAQQRLVSLALQLRLAAELADEDRPPDSAALMAMHRAATEAVEELRDLAQGVYPARLRDLGLAAALRSVARRSPTRITIDDSTSGALDDDVGLALYFVCVEAIQNAGKHGTPGTSIAVSLRDDGDDLVVEIADDGPGFEVGERRGARGLLNMEDRVSALGGRFALRSTPGSGTTVVARLPRSVAEPVGVGA